MTAIKYSRQRECIMEFLSSRKDHPTAEMVYHNVKRSCPRISLGTVYRNLSLLADLGEIARLGNIGGSERFDARTDPHFHFVCRVCGRVEDFDSMPVQALVEAAAEGFDGEILDFKANFFGICRACRGKQKTAPVESESL